MPRTDNDLIDQLEALACNWDEQSAAPDGPTIRKLDRTLETRDSPRSRGRYALAVVAAASLVTAGAVVAGVVNGSIDSEAGTAPATSPATTATTAPPSTSVDTTSTTVTTPDDTVGFIPTPVAAIDLGWPGVRLLPPSSSGYQVVSVAEFVVEDSGADSEPASALEPNGRTERREKTEYLATDPEDRRALLIHVTTYEMGSDADAAMASPHPITNDTIEEGSAEVAGLPATYVRTMAAAELSAGEPMHELLIARVRFDDNVVLDIAVPDGTLEQVAAIVDSARIDGDGRIVFDARLEGFGEPIVANDIGIDDIPGASDSSALGLALRHTETSATLSIEVRQGQTDAIDPAVLARQPTALAGENGYGFLRHGVFGEQKLLWITGSLVVTLDHYDRIFSDDELVELADSLRPVDDAAWAVAVGDLTGYRSTSVATE